jgi:hypothetical protein
MTWAMVAVAAGSVISAGISAYSASQQGGEDNSAAMINMMQGPREYKLDEKSMKNVVGKLDQMKATGKNITPEMYDSLYRAELQTAADIALKKQEANAGLGLKATAISEDARQFDEKMAAGSQEGSGELAGQGLGMLSGLLSKLGSGSGTGGGGAAGATTGMMGMTGAGYCIIVSTCTDMDSEQVNMARWYRDSFLDKETLRGYYMLSELVVPVLLQHDNYKKSVKNYFVDSMMEYFEYLFGIRPICSDMAKQETIEFLNVCYEIGKDESSFTRINGEVV